MAADSSMGFHHGITASLYNHHMLSFQPGSDAGFGGGGGGGAGVMVVPSRSAGGSSSNAGLFISPNNGVVGNGSGFGPSRSSSGEVFRSTGEHKYRFVTGPPSDWNEQELAILKEGLLRYAREPNIMKYIKIAAMLPNRTIRDVALRCWWSTGKDRRKKPDGFYTGKKIRDVKPVPEKMAASASMARFQMAPTNNVTPFSISVQHPNQQCQVPKEAPVIDNATQHLLEENNQLLNQIAVNIDAFKAEENIDLFLHTSNNIKTILSRMNETPGIISQMPPLPISANEDYLNSLLQLSGMVSYGTTRISHHTKQEPRS